MYFLTLAEVLANGILWLHSGSTLLDGVNALDFPTWAHAKGGRKEVNHDFRTDIDPLCLVRFCG